MITCGAAQSNHARATAYADGLRSVPGLRLLTDPPRVTSNAQYVVIEIDSPSYGRSRDELLAALEAENIMARRYFWPGAHRMEPYRSEQPNADLLLPETVRLSETLLTLPTGTAASLRVQDT